jgi:SAM-dependent methyltransferase
MSAVGPRLLEILRCPVSGSDLHAEEERLVCGHDDVPHSFPIVDGIPVLVPDDEVARRGETAIQRDRDAIREEFRTRSRSYYRDNYETTANAARSRRQTLIAERVRDLVEPEGAVLETGAGPAVLGETIRDLTHDYVALDLSLANLLEGRKRLGDLDAVVGDLTALPLRSDTFATVLAVGCLEYVRGWETAVAELVRVTRPGGTILATFANRQSPARWWEEGILHPAVRLKRSLRDDPRGRYGRYLTTPREVAAVFARGGATATEITYFNAGLVGYPLSRLARPRALEAAVADRFPRLKRLASEFLVVARKEPPSSRASFARAKLG